MEQPCYKCGQAVDEGVPFCPHCSAPQIRVVIAEPAPLAATAAPESSVALPSAPAAPQIDIPVQWSSAAAPCALAALIAAVVMVLQLVVPLIAVFGAGFLGVAFYRRRVPGVSLRAAVGARIGILSGFFCFGMSAALGALRVIILHEGDEIRHKLLDAVHQTAAHYPDAQYQPGLDFMRSPTGLVFMMVFLLIFAFISFLILGTLGGALGGTILGRRNKS